MPASPELTHQSVADRLGRTLTVIGRSADGHFIAPLDLVRVSDPATRGCLTTFTAELSGPLGTPLKEPGRYITYDGGRRHTLMLSWVTPGSHAIHFRATFVHRVPDEDLPSVRAVVGLRSLR